MFKSLWMILMLASVPVIAAPFEYEPTSDAVRREVNRHSSGIGRCYRDQKKLNPKLEGHFVLNFELDPHGKVSRLSLSGMKAKSAGLETCVMFEVGSWKFPQSSNGKMMRVRYSYSLD